MIIIDITVPIHPDMAVYEGDPPTTCRRVSRCEAGNPDSWNTSLLCMGTHTGTHVDPPLHFVEGGQGADELPLDVLCGPARVVDVRGEGLRIDADVLARVVPPGVERVLLRTDSQLGALNRDYAHLTEAAARWLRARGVKLIGIDTLSVEGYDSPGMAVHHELLAVPPALVVVEGLDLRGASEGDYHLVCLPMKLVGGDGAPARAVLMRPGIAGRCGDRPA